ncbi:MAG: DNA internalization-related competence protein ComEC/Rec2 [Chloroflexota bacterium]|nr:DNA internalization-related competence protein ComEC/Rec2 [Chloroflexota bacterium]
MAGARIEGRALLPALPLVAASFIAGTVGGAVLGGPWWATMLVAALAAGVVVLVAGRAVLGAPLVLLVALVATAAAGHARIEEAETRPPPPLARLSGTHDVVGVVRSDPRLSGTLARLDLRVESIDGGEHGGGLRLTMPAPRDPLREGDRIAVTAEIERAPRFDDFDYAAFLRSRGIHAVAAYPDRWDLLDRDAGNDVADALRRLRGWALDNVERALPEPEASLAAGMLLGRQRTMPAGLEDDLRRTGTTHLLVVSGQNVALLLGTAIALLTAVISRRRAALLALGLLPGYVVLVGAEPPVVRAAIMAVGIALAAVTGRRTPGWIYLVYALAIMLALRPLLVRDVAFQLSATATAGVMLVAPPLRDWAASRLRVTAEGATAALIEAGAIALGAALAVLPVQAASFGTVSLVQVPANVIVAPLYEATLLVAVAAALLGWFEPFAGLLHLAGVYAPAAFVAIVRVLAELPAAVVDVRAPLAVGAAWYGALAAGAWVLGRREPAALQPGARTGFAGTVALRLGAAGLWLAVLAPSDDLASVTVLDVGQGQAVLVRDGGASVLIDAGPPDGAVLRALARVTDARSLDAVVLSHDDADHAGGLRELERRLRVGVVLGDGIAGAEPFDIGDRIRLTDRTSIEVLSPPIVTAGRAHRGDNNRSLVLLVRVGDVRVLVPADIEADAEAWLVGSGLRLRADALVLPHHGSKSSSSPAFVEAVSPRVAIASAGAGNRHGHPHPDVLARYDGALLFRTDEHGDVTLRSDGVRLWVRSAR